MLRRLFRHEEGSVFAIVGLGILVLVGAVGVAVDVGRGQMAQAKLQSALDAAGLAAGAAVNSVDLDDEIQKYVNVNFSQGTLGATVTHTEYTLSDDGLLLTVDADATMPTSFMRIFGHDTMNLHAETQVTRSNKGMELALVLDVTLSMEGSKLATLKAASKDMLEILFGTGKYTAENLWVGIVPFSMGVNVGTTHSDWLDSTYFSSLDWGSTSWRGCTEARWTTGNDINDAPPSTEDFQAYYWPDDSNNDWIRPVSTTTSTTLCGPTNANSCQCTTKSGGTYTCNTTTSGNTTTTVSCSGSNSNKKCTRSVTTVTTNYVIDDTHGPNTYCPTSEVTPLTNDRHTLEDGIDDLVALGGTHIPEGLVWGWRLISPQWRGEWGGDMDTNHLPLDYNTDLMIKAVILMTDGENTMYGTADGAYGYTSQNHVGMTGTYTDTKAATKLNEKLTAICTAMKASPKNIIIYTVLFEENDPTIKALLKSCASKDDYFFDSPDEDTLKQAFKTIGDSLANLRISK